MIHSDGIEPGAKRNKKTYNVYLELWGSLGSSNEKILRKIFFLAECKDIQFTFL